MTVIPTGIDEERFAHGEGNRAHRKYGIPEQAFVVGHVGRLAPEKNLPFLARAVCRYLRSRPNDYFLLVGEGPSLDVVQQIARSQDVGERLLHPRGSLKGQALADVYHAMDLFAFASHSETQGMVLAEAMTAGVPVVAVNAPGAREVVRDGHNGRLLATDDEEAFAAAIRWCAERSSPQRSVLADAAHRTAANFAMPRCVEKLIDVYQQVTDEQRTPHPRDDSQWAALVRLIGEQWNIINGVVAAVGDSLFGSENDEDEETASSDRG